MNSSEYTHLDNKLSSIQAVQADLREEHGVLRTDVSHIRQTIEKAILLIEESETRHRSCPAREAFEYSRRSSVAMKDRMKNLALFITITLTAVSSFAALYQALAADRPSQQNDSAIIQESGKPTPRSAP